jgi:hypothetical protein
VNRYDLKSNERFRNGETTAKEVQAYVSEWFDTNAEGKVTFDAFVDAAINASQSYSQDQQFAAAMRASWGLY